VSYIASSANAFLVIGLGRQQQYQSFPVSTSTESPQKSFTVVLRLSAGIETVTTADIIAATTNDNGSHIHSLSSSVVDTIFTSIDTNNDGGISYEELHTNLEGIGYSSESIRSLFTSLDRNKDGMISRIEMQFAFANYETAALYKVFGVLNKAPTLIATIPMNNNDNANANDNDNDNNDDDCGTNTSAKDPKLLTKLADLIFDMIDTDNDEVIDAEHLRLHFIESVGMGSSGDGVSLDSSSTTFREVGHASSLSTESILKALDFNEDGVISREEMRAGFNQYDTRALSRALGLCVS